VTGAVATTLRANHDAATATSSANMPDA